MQNLNTIKKDMLTVINEAVNVVKVIVRCCLGR